MASLLHRDDPEKEPLVGHIKVTKDDWLNTAKDLLVSHGVAEVKILAMAEQMQVSRSSFYWYFRNRQDLLAALLDDWEKRNTQCLLDHCARDARNITQALCNFFRCFIDPQLFDPGLDFAIREWARRDPTVRTRIDAADAARIKAVESMYRNHGFTAENAETRARILYFMQLGYHALEVREDMETRMSRLPGYILGFTGQSADPVALQEFTRFAMRFTSD